MKEELEARENSFKRQKTEVDEKKRELERLKEEGARRRMEMDERKKKEAAAATSAEEEKETDDMEVDIEEPHVVGESKFSELDRTVKIKWRRKGAGELMDKAGLIDLFSRFGAIDECVVLSSKSEKEKKYASALVIFHNIAHAYAAVHRDKKALEEEDDEWGLFRDVLWASGKEPDLEFTKPSKPTKKEDSSTSKRATGKSDGSKPKLSKDTNEEDKFPTFTSSYKPSAKPAPSFSFKASSFKKSTSSEPPTLSADDDYESITLMRMRARAAEKRKAEQERLAQELLNREAEEDAAE
ncbi:hypothetical protein TWF694_002367 [Orbilia ellipsospora]